MKMTKVEKLWQAIILMFIRNDCRTFLTHDQSKLTISKQIKWFNEIYPNHPGSAYLFWNGIIPIGYGFIQKKEDGKNWISGGVIKMFRGKHFGSQLFKMLIGQMNSELWLDVFKTNTAALRIYRKLGFRKWSEDITQYGQVIVMKRRAYV
jgi:RimJ/RimL family protein N-acetyltransferase